MRVLEVAAWTFVPAAGAVLADWGADVIKVEHPVTGDPQRGLFNAMAKDGGPNPMLEVPNRGKRSLALNLESDEGRDVLYRLAKDSDVFLTSFLPTVRRKLRIDLEDIRAHNPSIVYARGTGFGPRGPDAEKAGFDLASTWARAGLAFQTTLPGASEPAPMPGSIGDLTGGLTLAGAIGAALFRRERTGEPQEVDVSLYHVGMWMLSQWITAAPLGLARLPRDRAQPMNPLVNSYRTKDDRWLWLVFIQPDRWWPDLCRHLEREELIDDPRFVDFHARETHRSECMKVLEEIFATKTLADWRRIFETLDGAWAPGLSPAEVAGDAQVLANGYFPEVPVDGGESFRIVAAPTQFGGEPVGDLRAMPEHGQHTEEVLLELGFSWDDIAGYKDRSVIP